MANDKRISGISLVNVIIIVLIIAVVSVISYPIRMRLHSPMHDISICQKNMKELGIAFQLYHCDYDNMLPSSAIGGGKTWDVNRFKRFATMRGVIPPQDGTKDPTWPMLLYSHMNKDAIWCNGGKTRKFLFWSWYEFGSIPDSPLPSTTVSYWYKAAVDLAWFGGPDGKGPKCQKEGDFDFLADQIIFYERSGIHWRQENEGLTDGVTINCTFMDGHVAAKRLANSTNKPGKADPTAPGEPAFYNYQYLDAPVDPKIKKPQTKVYGPKDEIGWNPHKGGDKLP